MAAANSPAEFTTRMPRPPPPADALTMTGNPISRAMTVASSTSLSIPSLPGTIGRPAVFMVRLASALSPMRRIISGLGPMNVNPHDSQTSTKCAFSDRNP